MDHVTDVGTFENEDCGMFVAGRMTGEDVCCTAPGRRETAEGKLGLSGNAGEGEGN